MIIWINGAFGSGKTSTAFELYRRLPNSHVFDPEEAGYYIRKNVPKEVAKRDFQDFPMWRDINYQMLYHLSQNYKGVVIVPMTIVDPLYFEEIVGRLRDQQVSVHHFTLWAEKETLQKRLRKRGERKGSWAEQQIERCLTGLSHECFETRVSSEQMSVQEQVEWIADKLALKLNPDTRGPMKKKLDQWRTQIQHIRWFQ
ncbi:AAA family ATPase [Paenibacillus sp. 1001270B_150601_E10]|uniref:AAA family ATPase n=1 Tax=Paenibacillus sp. 1001270B_150601_E10 TaxID=2787079 RepID=UPI00189E6032|nr:AAA family ATPase [Paenibacillus sp. 1001270B_150601_E10]